MSSMVIRPPMQRTPIAEAVATATSSSPFVYAEDMLLEVWDSAVGAMEWLLAVVAGEFVDNRPASALVTEALLGFVPGVAIVQSARDAVAISLRLIMHPERRSDWMEWVLLCVHLIVVALPVVTAAVSAAVGAAGAGIGAIAGAAGGLLAGSELAAVVRALLLLLLRGGVRLAEIVRYLSKWIKGDIVKLLKAMKFDALKEPLLAAIKALVGQCMRALRAARVKLEALLKHVQETQAAKWLADNSAWAKAKMEEGLKPLRTQIAKLAEWERRFYGFQEDAVKQIPLLLTEWQARLTRVLAEALPKDAHLAGAGVKAEAPVATQISQQTIHSSAAKPLREAENRMLSQMGKDAPGSGAKGAGVGGKATTAQKTNTSAAQAKAQTAKQDAPAVKTKPDESTPPPNDKANTKKKEAADLTAAADKQHVTDLVKAGKIDEARAYLKEKVLDNPNIAPADKPKALADRLDVSTTKDKARFWSGEKAFEEAKKSGEVLETTTGGQVMNGWDDLKKAYPDWFGNPPPGESDFWAEVSRNYAQGAEGEIGIFHDASKAAKGGGFTWLNTEQGAVFDSIDTGKITEMTYEIVK